VKLILANFDNVFGLKGNINFTPKAPVILYAPNISGKTNAITAIRMCFIGHKIYKDLYKEESILKPLKEGSTTCYFSQWNNLFRITYKFKRTGEKVSRSCKLLSAPLMKIEGSTDEIHKLLEAQVWKEEASNPKEIKKRLEEIEIYPEIMDILLASSNIDGYLRAIEGEVCEIPEALSKQLTDFKNEADLNLKRIEKFKGEIELLEEKQKEYINNQKKFLKNISVRQVKIQNLFTGNVSDKLEKYTKQINQRLARGIPEDTQKAISASKSLEPNRGKLESIESIKESIEKIKELKPMLKRLIKIRNSKDQWVQVSDVLNFIPQDVWSLDSYSTPKVKKSLLSTFKNSRDIEILLKSIKQSCIKIRKAKRITLKYDVDSFSYLKRTVEELNTVLSRLKNPQELPEKTVPALVCIFPKQQLPTVSIPINKYESNLAKVANTTTIYIPEKILSSEKRKIELRIKEIESSVNDLNKSLSLFKEVDAELKEMVKLINKLTKEKEKELKDSIEKIEEKSSKILNEWIGISTILYNNFNLGKMYLKFKEDTYEKDISELKNNLNQSQDKFEGEIKKILSAFPRLRLKLLKKMKTTEFDTIAKDLNNRVEKLKKETEKLTKIQNWLQKEAEVIKESDYDLKCTRILLKKVIPFSQIYYSLASKLINLEEIVDSLGNGMERHVETAYASIFVEPTFKFTHIGNGKFIPKLDDQPISFMGPSGSQSAAVSFGVLYTLADQYKLPLVMDEAADRFDPIRLTNFLELVRRITLGATEEEAKQVCLAMYESKNVSAEVLANFNTYECVRISNTEKRIRPYTIKN